jgi:hypothetical protein
MDTKNKMRTQREMEKVPEEIGHLVGLVEGTQGEGSLYVEMRGCFSLFL